MPLAQSLERGDRRAPRRTSSSTCPTSPFSVRGSGSCSRAARSPRGCRTWAPTSASTRRALEPFPLPSMAVVGTGKRVGKTAVTGHAGAAAGGRTGAWSSSRWAEAGRRSPSWSRSPPTLETLLALSRAGRHAASDHLETAALAGVPTDRLPPLRRRAGRRDRSSRTCSRARASRPALSRTSSSSTAAAPRSRRSRPERGSSSPTTSRAGLNPYRALISDLVLTMRRRGRSRPRRRSAWPVLRFDLRLRAGRAARRPAGGRLHHRPGRSRPPRGRGLLVARTWPTAPGSPQDLEEADAEVYVVELKAAAIDLVAETAPRRGASTSCSRRTRCVAPGLDEALLAVAELADRAAGRRESPAMTEPRHADPSPLGGADGLPYSKGLMARALMAAGVPAVRAYELADARPGSTSPTRGERGGRPRPARGARRRRCWARTRAPRRSAACAATTRSASSTCRSSCSSAARPARGSRRSRPTSPTGSGSRA